MSRRRGGRSQAGRRVMRFRRAGQRYSTTPVPVTPYQQAAPVWDERIGSARAQARNWRWMAFGCLGLSLLMVVGLLWQLGSSPVARESAVYGKRWSVRV